MRFSRAVVKHRVVILIVALLLLVPSVMGMLATRINYDMLTYLPEDMDTVVGQNVLLDDFGKGAFSMLIAEDMPAKDVSMGHKHPMSIVLDEMKEIFIGMGFTVVDGPEIESTHNNFDALNAPADHPSRDFQDTFYIDETTLLRTQTSPVQIRAMTGKTPPIRVISPGRVYRSDDVDATHSPMFHQIEGLVVDKGITMADLKGTLDLFARSLFGEETRTRFRPHNFPFTEPSAEVDVSCFVCGGKGCRLCKGEGWIEILGAGMVHPDVLAGCGIDPEVYSGFAFGMGVERVAMRRYNINDMRLFFENDVRFLSQF